MKNYKHPIYIASSLVLLFTWVFSANPVFAHRSPANCLGSGLGINLFTYNPQVHIGDVISYDVEVFNGTSGPIVCDATDITASVITPDGVVHPLTLIRTSLLNGEMDSYPAIVSYTARAQDIQGGMFAATASDTGTIHQNDTNSIGGGFQGLNVTVIVPATLHVVKSVINNNGGTTNASDFNLHVKFLGADVSGSPAGGAGTPGTTYSLDPGTYLISEDVNTFYGSSFSGDCNLVGSITLTAGQDATCIITNDDVAPPPSPPPPPSNSPVGNLYLQVAPVAILVAQIEPVIVLTIPLVVPPPVIHITKIPSRLTPFAFGGGDVIYSYTVTNPGLVSMHDVVVTDDKCSPVSKPFGDVNGNNLLETSETWSYACFMNIAVSTTNVATASGQANGRTATGYAFATVVVLAPTLPNAGFFTTTESVFTSISVFVLILLLASIPIVLLFKKPQL